MAIKNCFIAIFNFGPLEGSSEKSNTKIKWKSMKFLLKVDCQQMAMVPSYLQS
jgi:hypothetical protein